MAMMLAMNGLLSREYNTMRDKANEMYPRVLNANGDAYVAGMVAELKRQGMDSKTKNYLADSAWSEIKKEINFGRPVIVRTAHGVVTAAGHFFVAVGYREATGIRQVIVYDPFGRWQGTCCTGNYDLNSPDPSSRKGQWVSYDFDRAFGTSNWLITASGNISTAINIDIVAAPSSAPDAISDEPESIGTYFGVNAEVEETIFLPLIRR
jgi:hypothetical protein